MEDPSASIISHFFYEKVVAEFSIHVKRLILRRGYNYCLFQVYLYYPFMVAWKNSRLKKTEILE